MCLIELRRLRMNLVIGMLFLSTEWMNLRPIFLLLRISILGLDGESTQRAVT